MEADSVTKLYVISSTFSLQKPLSRTFLIDLLNTQIVSVFHLSSQDEAFFEAKECDVIRQLLQQFSIPLIVENSVESFYKCKAGGIYLDGFSESSSVKEIREKLGVLPVIGVACGTSLDEAMQAGEDKADFVIFENDDMLTESDFLERVAFWASDTLLPCVVKGTMTLENILSYKKHHIDFIAPDANAWSQLQENTAIFSKFK